MKKVLFGLLFSVLLTVPAFAESLVVSSCGTLPQAYAAGATRLETIDVNGVRCTNASSTSTVTQGPSGTNAAAWWMRLGDTTNGPVTVNPPSTAALATNTSLAVQLTPNSPGVIALGQTTKASSVPVTFATDQYGDPCSNPLIAKSSVPINITSGTTTELVPISGSTTIYVCHFSFTISEVVTTANTLQFEHGTSNNCTGTNKLTGLYGAGGVTAGDPIVVTAGFGGTIFATAAAHDLCALTAIGASGSFQGVLTYVQQ